MEDDVGTACDRFCALRRAPRDRPRRSRPCREAGGFAGETTSSSVSLSIGLPLSPPSLTSRSVSLRPIMPAAPVMRICTSVRPVGARCHAVQFAQAHLLLARRVEILRRQPALEGGLARRPFAVEHRVIGGVAVPALGDQLLAQDALEDEAIAQSRAPRRRVQRIAFPFVAPVAQRLERVAREQILRLGAERRTLQRPANRRYVRPRSTRIAGRISISVAMPTACPDRSTRA